MKKGEKVEVWEFEFMMNGTEFNCTFVPRIAILWF